MSDNRTKRDRTAARTAKNAAIAWLAKRTEYLLEHPELLHTVEVTR